MPAGGALDLDEVARPEILDATARVQAATDCMGAGGLSTGGSGIGLGGSSTGGRCGSRRIGGLPGGSRFSWLPSHFSASVLPIPVPGSFRPEGGETTNSAQRLRPRPPLDSGRSLLRRSVGANLGDLPILLTSSARNADGADDLAVGDNWDASFERCRSRQGKRAKDDTDLPYQVLEHFDRPTIIKRTIRLFFQQRGSSRTGCCRAYAALPYGHCCRELRLPLANCSS